MTNGINPTGDRPEVHDSFHLHDPTIHGENYVNEVVLYGTQFLTLALHEAKEIAEKEGGPENPHEYAIEQTGLAVCTAHPEVIIRNSLLFPKVYEGAFLDESFRRAHPDIPVIQSPVTIISGAGNIMADVWPEVQFVCRNKHDYLNQLSFLTEAPNIMDALTAQHLYLAKKLITPRDVDAMRALTIQVGFENYPQKILASEPQWESYQVTFQRLLEKLPYPVQRFGKRNRLPSLEMLDRKELPLGFLMTLDTHQSLLPSLIKKHIKGDHFKISRLEPYSLIRAPKQGELRGVNHAETAEIMKRILEFRYVLNESGMFTITFGRGNNDIELSNREFLSNVLELLLTKTGVPFTRVNITAAARAHHKTGIDPLNNMHAKLIGTDDFNQYSFYSRASSLQMFKFLRPTSDQAFEISRLLSGLNLSNLYMEAAEKLVQSTI